MAYQLGLKLRVAKDLAKLPAADRTKLESEIEGLATDPRPHGVTKLHGRGSRYRIRVGDYRVVYEVNDKAQTVSVLAVGHRREVYR